MIRKIVNAATYFRYLPGSADRTETRLSGREFGYTDDYRLTTPP